MRQPPNPSSCTLTPQQHPRQKSRAHLIYSRAHSTQSTGVVWAAEVGGVHYWLCCCAAVLLPLPMSVTSKTTAPNQRVAGVQMCQTKYQGRLYSREISYIVR